MDQTADIPSIINSAATANGVDPAYLLSVAHAESGLDPQAAAHSSSAKGLFQITDGTWKQYGNGDPYDPVANANAGARLTADNMKALSAAGIQPSNPNLYLAHFAGTGGAIKALSADPSASAAAVLGPQAAQANPFLRRMSVADLQNWAAGKFGSSASASASPPPAGAAVASASAAPAPPLSQAAAPTSSPSDLGQLDSEMAALAASTAQQDQLQPAPMMQLSPNAARLRAVLARLRGGAVGLPFPSPVAQRLIDVIGNQG